MEMRTNNQLERQPIHGSKMLAKDDSYYSHGTYKLQSQGTEKLRKFVCEDLNVTIIITQL